MAPHPNPDMGKELTQETLRKYLSYDPETGVFTRIAASNVRHKFSLGCEAGRTDSRGRRKVAILGREYFAHRLAFFYMMGRWPESLIDHIDGDHSNNRWSNLREASPRDNNQNRSSRSWGKSGVLGVRSTYHPSRWQAAIKHDGKDIYLGTYGTVEEAAAAYDAAKRKLHAFQPAPRDRVPHLSSRNGGQQ